MAYGYILNNFEYCVNKCTNYSYATPECENATQIVYWNLSDQITRRSEVTTGVHKPLHLKLQEFQKLSEGNANNKNMPTTSKKRKRCATCFHPQQLVYQNISVNVVKRFCLEHSNIICDTCYDNFKNPSTENSH